MDSVEITLNIAEIERIAELAFENGVTSEQLLTYIVRNYLDEQ